jgi:predicted nucleic acid-binding Zn ribbon protein
VSYREPRQIAEVVARVVDRAAPATTLARVQRCWGEVAGDLIAAEATPVAEQSGMVTVACRSAVWANELELLSKGLIEGLNESLGGPAVGALKFVVRGSRPPG